MNGTHGISANGIDANERIDHAEEQGNTKEPDTDTLKGSKHKLIDDENDVPPSASDLSPTNSSALTQATTTSDDHLSLTHPRILQHLHHRNHRLLKQIDIQLLELGP